MAKQMEPGVYLTEPRLYEPEAKLETGRLGDQLIPKAKLTIALRQMALRQKSDSVSSPSD